MTPLMRNLTVLLIAQLMLALWLFSSNSDDIVSEPLLPQLSQADVLELSSKDSDAVLQLQKQDNTWRLADSALPVSQSKIDNLLRDLTAVKTGWPVAQSSAAQSRFSVSADKFEQKLALKRGDTELATLYLGDSPAFRQLYLRKDGDDAIYKVALNRFELSTDESAWLDKQLLRLPIVESLSQGDNRLLRDGANWTVQLAGESKVADADAARDLAAKLSSLTVLKRVAAPLSSDFTELHASSGSRDYTYQLLKQDDKALIRRTDIDYWFELSQYQYDELQQINWTALAKPAESEVTVAADNATETAASDSGE